MHRLSKVSVVMLVLLCAAAMAAQTGGAMLHVTGKVTLNGTAVADSSSIFAGDRLTTAEGAMATINRPGMSVVLGPNSTIQYGISSIQVIQGSARIAAGSNLTTQAGNVTVVSQDQTARFEVSRADGKVVVASREGSVSVNDGGHSVTVAAGTNATLAVSGSNPVVQQGNIASKTETTSGVVASGPLYSINVSNDDLPICSSVKLCQRQNVSQIRPCKCQP